MLRTSLGRFETPARVWAAAGELVRAFKRRDHRRRWRQPWPRRILTRLGWLLGALLLGLTLVSVASVLVHAPLSVMKDAKRQCDDAGFACNIASSVFFTVGPLLVGSFWFVSFTLWRVRRPLLKRARTEPRRLVETAGQITGNVVGRDDICNVLQHNLADRKDRRPYVLVGGVGIGKTAVLVRLTELLARRGAVPVPIRLRDAKEDVDFIEMARQAFLRETRSPHLLAAAGQRAWDRLLQMDRIVVLADGLEEALADSDDIDQERDHRVRTAVSQARRHGYPLVITSREHDALSALDAALLRLEPLSEEAALDYIEQDQRVEDERRLSQIVENADVVRMPLYLQIARELHESGQLGDNILQTRSEDPVWLRMKLAGSWVGALIEGNLDKQPVALNANERKAAVLHLAALACCGLARDTIQVEFEMWEAKAHDAGHAQPVPCYPDLKEILTARIQPIARMTLEELGEEQRSAYTRSMISGERGAPESRRWEVNMQIAATNGARLGLIDRRRKGVRFRHSTMQAYLGSWMIGEALKEPAFQEQAFRAPGRELLMALIMFSRRREARERRPDEDVSWLSWLSKRLCEAAMSAHLSDAKRIEMLAAAVEIDSVNDDSDHQHAVTTLADQWAPASSWEDAPRDAKLVATDLVGAAARRLTQPSRDESPAFGFYERLYSICCNERNYQIRLAAAHEIGAGGEHAFEELKDLFRQDMPEEADDRLKQIADRKNTLGDGENRYRYSAQAWLLPMIVGSGADSDEAKKLLGEWLELVGKGMPPWLEAALAQGFKYAANRRPQHPYERAETRAYLAARAEEMLEGADYWFSRLALLHALCLWGLSGTLHASGDRDDRPNPRAVVKRWAERRDGNMEHRFVREAADLAVKALATRQPERFIWIDESGIATTVGSRSKRTKPHALAELWIPPSAGWLILDMRAQQLVADVLILLTLAERGDRPEDWETNLRKINREDLPHCLTQERDQHLRPAETAGLTKRPPGDTCKGGCPVKLCPYPPKGQQPYRVELSEAFCRKQRELLGRTMQPRFRQAPWQNAPRSELRRFWREMERRART